MSITFSVIDTICEVADQSFFVPQIRLQAVSTTTFTTWYGYDEFIPSEPPKKYKKMTVSGTSTRVGFTAEQTPRQCGGAKYVYSGFGSVNSKGKQITSYQNSFFAQCSKQYWPPEPIPVNPNSIYSDPLTGFPKFVSYCWPTDFNSCGVCDPAEANWPLIFTQNINVSPALLTAFQHTPGSPVITATSWSINDVFTALTEISTNGPYSSTLSGVTYDVTVGGNTYTAQSVFTNPPTLNFPPVEISGFVAEYVVFTDTNNYSFVLSEEYTDLEAAANAQIVTGTGTSATNQPRDTGFTTVTTSVVFTLFCSNLISGKDYVVTVDKWNQSPQIFEQPPVSIHTLTSYGFTATGPTHTITDTIPVPTDPFSTITVRDPTIVFSV